MMTSVISVSALVAAESFIEIHRDLNDNGDSRDVICLGMFIQ